MPNTTFPDMLVDLARRFEQAERDVRDLLESLPLHARAEEVDYTDIHGVHHAAHRAWTDEERAHLAELRAKAARLAAELIEDPHWASVPREERVDARMALKHLVRQDRTPAAAV